jgi:hypothetical protein
VDVALGFGANALARRSDPRFIILKTERRDVQAFNLRNRHRIILRYTCIGTGGACSA